MKVALIGLGVIGRVHFDVVSKTGENLVAVCDTDKSKLLSLGDLKGVRFFCDYIEMLDAVKPDIVHICTPHYLHAEMIINALKRNINVLCEKPLCIDKNDILRILEAEKNSTAQLGVCFQNRYNDSTVFAREYLKNKKILSAHGILFWCRNRAYYEKDAWRGTLKQEGGGVLINQAIHTIDLLQWLVGMPKTVIGWCENLSLKNVIETEDTATVLCKGDVDFSISASNAAQACFQTEIIIRTENNTLRLLPNGVYVGEKFYDTKSMEEIYGKVVYGCGHIALINDFYDHVKSGRKFPIDGAEGAKAVKIVLASYESKGSIVEIS